MELGQIQKMETTASTTATAVVRSLRKASSSSNSFKLRSPSLNSLRLRRIFDVFDKNHDNMITVDELSRALSILGLDTDLSELDSMVKSYIQPGNLGLRFQDFEALHRSINDLFFGNNNNIDAGAASSLEQQEQEHDHEQDEITTTMTTVLEEGSSSSDQQQQEEADLTEAFKVFDEDGDGYISAMELQVVLGKLGFPEASQIDRVEMMISSVDRNHDGRVDFFEFKNMMRSVIVRSS